MAVRVFTAEESLAAAKTDVTKVLIIVQKKTRKEYSGTEFLNAYWNIAGLNRKEGWFTLEDIELSDGMADPENTDDIRNKFEGTRLQLQTKTSLCGAFGEFLNLLNAQWVAQVKELGESGAIDLEGKKIHELLQTTLSKKNKNSPGGAIEDPVIRFGVDFGNFPATHPNKALRGQPKTQFYDARTEYLDEAGRVQYKLATIINDDGEEEFVNTKNVHKFVTSGSRIVRMRLSLPSVVVSASWVSLPITANRVILMPGEEGGFTDDDYTPQTTAILKAAFVQPVQLAPEVKIPIEDRVEVITISAPSDEIDFEDVLANL